MAEISPLASLLFLVVGDDGIIIYHDHEGDNPYLEALG